MVGTARHLPFIVIAAALLLPAAAHAQKRDPAKAKLHEQRAKAARNIKQWGLTIAEYRRAYQYDPDPKYLFNIGLASDFAGDKVQALAAFRAYLKKEPNGTYASAARAKVKELFAAVEQQNKQAAAAHLRSATSYRKSGRHDAAAFGYRKAYELSKNAEYLFEAAESYRAVGANKRAVESYKQYLAVDAAGKFAISARRHIDELEKAGAEPRPARRTASVTTASVTTEPAISNGVTQEAKKTKKKNKWLWVAAGAAAIAAGIAADTLPGSVSNGSFDGTDLLPVGLYGAGITAIVIGVF